MHTPAKHTHHTAYSAMPGTCIYNTSRRERRKEPPPAGKRRDKKKPKTDGAYTRGETDAQRQLIQTHLLAPFPDTFAQVGSW